MLQNLTRFVAAGVLLALPCTLSQVETIARDDFSQDANNPGAGWAAPWNMKDDLKIDTGKKQAVGQGYAMRPLLQPVDFSADGEYFFRVTIERTGLKTQGNSYAAVQLFNKDKAVENRPLRMGIDSGDRFMFGLGTNERLDMQTKGDTPYTLVARLTTKADGPDVLDGWAFEGAEAPAQMPDQPQITSELDYDDKVADVRLQTGVGDGYEAHFRDLRIGTTWQDVTGQAGNMPEPTSFKHEFREIPRLQVFPTGTHAIPIQWSNVSLIPGPAGESPGLLVQGSYPWIVPNSVMYRPADDSTRQRATPAPNPDLPLYAAPEPYDQLPRAQYQAVRQADDQGWDLYNLDKLARVATVDAAGRLVVLSKPEPLLTGDEATAALDDVEDNVKQLADADGDGVIDLLVGEWIDRSNDYWPRGEAVWSMTPLPHVGPHADVEVTDGFRGYDIDGNWLGAMRTKELGWMKGSRDGDRVTLGERKPVYYGRDNYAVQWRNPGRKLAPAVITARPADGGEERRFVVLFSGDGEVKALPVLDTPDAPGELYLGKAVDLIDPDTPTRDVFLTVVRNTIDMTGDGREEIVIGTGANGRAIVLAGDTVGQYKVLGALENVGGPLGADTLTVPARADWDGDGTPDLVTGDGTGYYMLYPGTDDPLVYAGSRTFQRPDGSPVLYKGMQNLQGPHESGWSYSQPTLFDWNADGQLDLIGNDNTNTLRLHQRKDGAEPWVIGTSDTFTYNGAKLGIGWRSRMAGLLGDYRLAGDDRPVLLFIDLDSELKLAVPASVGSTEIVEILPVQHTDGSPIVTAGSAGMSGRTQLSTPDWDGDGTWDIMFNVPAKTVPMIDPDPRRNALADHLKTSAIFWLKNVGTNADPKFDPPRRVTYKDGSIIRTETHSMNVEPTDLNGDGRLDLLFGDGPGFVYYLMRDELAWD